MALFSPRPLPDTDTESGVPAVSTPGLFLIPFRDTEREKEKCDLIRCHNSTIYVQFLQVKVTFYCIKAVDEFHVNTEGFMGMCERRVWKPPITISLVCATILRGGKFI